MITHIYLDGVIRFVFVAEMQRGGYRSSGIVTVCRWVNCFWHFEGP